MEPQSFVFLVSFFASPGSRPASVTSEGVVSCSCGLSHALGVSFRLFAAGGFFSTACFFLWLYDVGVVGSHQRRSCKLRHATRASPPNRDSLLSQPSLSTSGSHTASPCNSTHLSFFPSADPWLAQVNNPSQAISLHRRLVRLGSGAATSQKSSARFGQQAIGGGTLAAVRSTSLSQANAPFGELFRGALVGHKRLHDSLSRAKEGLSKSFASCFARNSSFNSQLSFFNSSQCLLWLRRSEHNGS